MGARAHYDDPAYYRATYGGRIDDVQFYVALAARCGGPVLEYGVGDGRIAVPIARHGIEIFGVDHSAPMLQALRARIATEPPEVRARVRWRAGDMRNLRLRGKRFPLVVCTFNTALHLYTRSDVERFLVRVREHMTSGGLFVADLAVPSLADLARDPARLYRTPRFRHPTTGELVRYGERYDYDGARQILFVSTEFEPADHPERSWTAPLAHRQFFPQEWEALLHYNGFRVERVDGDFHGGPLGPASDVMVWHARRRR